MRTDRYLHPHLRAIFFANDGVIACPLALYLCLLVFLTVSDDISVCYLPPHVLRTRLRLLPLHFCTAFLLGLIQQHVLGHRDHLEKWNYSMAVLPWHMIGRQE